MLNFSLSRLQSLVGLTAGLISIVGAVASTAQFLGPTPRSGDIVAVVQDARSGKTVPDATVEILSTKDALITTRTSAADGRARHSLPAGAYRLRVSHPKFGGEVRRIQVLAGQTSEVHVQLRAVTRS